MCLLFLFSLLFSTFLASQSAHKVTNTLQNVGNLQHLYSITITVANLEISKTFASKAVTYTCTSRCHLTCLLIFHRLAKIYIVFRILLIIILWNFTTIRPMWGQKDGETDRYIGACFCYSFGESVHTSWDLNYWASRFDAFLPRRDIHQFVWYAGICVPKYVRLHLRSH
jgi:hypothetical protein